MHRAEPAGCSGRVTDVLCHFQMRLREMGVLQPTQVQQEAIPKALTGVNIAIQCYTGSGKVGICTTQCVPTVILRANHRHAVEEALSCRLVSLSQT
jgi:hypothetical protein